MTALLAIDASTEACTAALLVDDACIERFVLAPRQHAALLLKMINELLIESGLSLKQLDAIGFAHGPGSFMGVRLATGVAQGLAFGASLPLVPISSLRAIAQQGLQTLATQHAVVGWDARMGEVYWGCYESDVNGVMHGKDFLSAPQDIVLASGADDWVLLGNAWQVYQDALPKRLQRESHLVYPHAGSLARLATHEYLLGNMQSPERVEPQYLRNKVAG